MFAISSCRPSTRLPRSASMNEPGKISSSVPPRAFALDIPYRVSMARLQRTTQPFRSSTRMPESIDSRMFSLYSVSSCSWFAFSCRSP